MDLAQGAMKLRMTKAASLDIAGVDAVAIKAQINLKTSDRFSIHPIVSRAIAVRIAAGTLTTALAAQSVSPSITPKARPLLPATALRRLAAA
jgi:hypothetical protein